MKNKDGGEYENWCWPGNIVFELEMDETQSKDIVCKSLLTESYISHRAIFN